MPLGEADEQIIQYLLDNVDEHDRLQLEERLFRDPSFSEHVSAVEEDMIMQYVRGDLNTNLLPRFTDVYLGSSSRRAQVDKARLWQHAVREAVQIRSAVRLKRWRLGLSSAAAVAAIVLLAVLWPYSRNHPPVQRPDGGGGSEAIVTLQPGLLRSGGGLSIHVPPATRIRFHLVLAKADAGATYRATVGTPEHPNVWNGPAERQGEDIVTVVPADLLSPGDYTLQLQVKDQLDKFSPAGSYYFRLER